MGKNSRPGAALLIIAALALTGCASSPSYESVAADCGGRQAGINADETAVVVAKKSEALTCVVEKIFPAEADQAVIADNLWGDETQLQVGDYEVSFVAIGGEEVVAISRSE